MSIISEDFQDAAFILNGKKPIQALTLLDKIYKALKKIKTLILFIPGICLSSGETGYVVIEFDITKKGKSS